MTAPPERIWARAFELYRYAMGIILIVLAGAIRAAGATAIWQDWQGHPSQRSAAAWLHRDLLFQPTFMDFCRKYIVYMIIAPGLIGCASAGAGPLSPSAR